MAKLVTKNFHNNTVIQEIMQVLLLATQTPKYTQNGYWAKAPTRMAIAIYDPRFKEYKPIDCNVYCYLKQKGWDFDTIMNECLHTAMKLDGKDVPVVSHDVVDSRFEEIVYIPAFALYEVLHRMHFKPKKAKRCKNTNGSR